MTLLDHLALMSAFDAIAVSLLLLSWLGISWRIEHPAKGRKSVTSLMAEYRRDWMSEFVTRDNRIFDATLVASLRQGTSFFASTCILAIGGVLALVGNTAPLRGVAEEFTSSAAPTYVWQLKLMFVALFLTNAFLKFVWAHRVFGYCSVVMGSVPNDPEHPLARPRARQAAELNIRAAVNYNRGLQSMYFALGTLAWLMGPVPLLIAIAVVVWLLWSREFASIPRDVLESERREP